MAKIVRKTAVQFGSGAGFQQIAQFGSLAAAAIAYSTDPAVIQGLSNWVDGWFSAILGGNSPAIEDMNAMSFVYGYQIAYLMQAGIPEYDSGTTYYTGSLCNSAGVIYVSKTDANIGNAVSNATYWKSYNLVAPTVQTFTSSSGTYTTPTSPAPLYIEVVMVGGGGGGGEGGGATGGTGGTSSFGTTLLSANGGVGGVNVGIGGAGGVASLGSGPVGVARQGGSGGSNFGSTAGVNGGNGAPSPLGGAGGGGADGGSGNPAVANTGSGGGGSSTGSAGAGGGGAGGYVFAKIYTPLATYAYVVGVAGTVGATGGLGGSGFIQVTEYYQ